MPLCGQCEMELNRPSCCDQGAKLVRYHTGGEEFCTWWCNRCECIVLSGDLDGVFLPCREVEAYIKRWGRSLKDLPVVPSNMSVGDVEALDRLVRP